MRNLVLAFAAIAILTSTIGCANGPIRQWLRGAPCSTCNPQFAPQHSGILGGCNSGTCATGTCGTGLLSSQPNQPTGNGILSGIFGGQQNANAGNLPPASIPASSFEAAPTIGSNIDLYGNTNTVGRIELPPTAPFN